jgi:hypothetical protein
VVPATGPEVTAGGTITATLSFGTAALALPADQVAQVKADVYARPRPRNSILVGSARADISPGEQVRLQIPCHLPATGGSPGLFAAVQLFSARLVGRTPSSELPDAEMTLSRARVPGPGNPGPGVERNSGALV